MKWKTILLTALFLSTTIVQGAEENKTPTAYEVLRDTVSKLTLNTGSTRNIEGIFIEHGVFTITLDGGVMTAMNDVDGRTIGYLFNGKGTVLFQPRILTERVNLERFYGEQMFMEDITSAMILCTDNTVTDQFDLFADSPSTDTIYNQEYAQIWQKFALEGSNETVPSSIARALLNNLSEGFFQAHLLRTNEMSSYIQHDPFEVEPYTLTIEKLGNRFKAPVLVNRCPEPGATRVMNDDGVDHGDLVATDQHTMSVELDNSLDMVVVDRLAMKVVADSLRWLDLSLYPDLIIDSIALVDDIALQFFRAEDSYTAWIHLPRWYKKGEPLELVLHYHGDVFDRIGDQTILMTSFTWYASHSYKHKAFYDVSFSYPAPMTLACVGRRTQFTDNGNRKTARWVTGRRVRNESFHIGMFKRMDIETPKGIPSATILYNTSNQVDAIATDIRQTLEFFTKFYGELPVDSLIATELPGFHGEAFPGLLHLSSLAFNTSSYDDEQFFEEGFIAHEVGHQWWGIAVDFESYRDQWLSEGFAQYSSLMYAQMAAASKDKLFKMLENFRDDIMQFGKRDIGADVPPPAIALGYRASFGAQDRSAYQTFIYNKGAWVLHMLRNLLLNLDTMKEDAFMSVMKSFYHSHKNRRATTDDFRKTVEDVIGLDMQWFFDQWVYGNQIPEFTWAYSSTEDPDGTYANLFRIRQEGVDSTFRSYIPIKVVYEDGTWNRFRVQMVGEVATLKLPQSKTEIDEVVFNEFLSVLCKDDEESF